MRRQEVLAAIQEVAATSQKLLDDFVADGGTPMEFAVEHPFENGVLVGLVRLAAKLA